MYSQIYMELALNEAWKYQLLTYPNPAVGALVLYRGEIVALEAHQKAGTSHAEVLALLRAYEHISGSEIDFDRFDAQRGHQFLRSLPKNFFHECSIFVTLEPCSHTGKTPACGSLLAHLKPQKVYIATLDPIPQHGGGVELLRSQNIEVEVGILEGRAKQLIEPFLIWQTDPFLLFKLAQTSNGKIGGGYLSSKEALIHVHRLRRVCSWMVIGGNTVRVDRPTLDCRFINGKAPDVTILSQRQDFDRAIPLFSVPDRGVQITSSLQDLDTPSFILIEGGEGLLNLLKAKIDWLLLYQTPKLSKHNSNYNLDLNLEFLHQDRVGKDLRVWSRVNSNLPYNY